MLEQEAAFFLPAPVLPCSLNKQFRYAGSLYQFSLVVKHLLSWGKGEGGKGKACGYFLSPLPFNLFPFN
jgi:hypothetical protein